jgi:mannosyl-3-phosphoglycerate phosphatase
VTTVATDLDGTLLDAGGTLGAPAREALHALKEKGVGVVLLTSKTEAELREWLFETHAPLGAFENGAGIVGPRGTWIDPAALRVEVLTERLSELERRCGAPLVPIAALSDEALCARTGLSAAAAERARQRVYDLPFLAPARTASELRRALAGIPGVTLVRGGVFWHLCGRHGKGTALGRLDATYRLSRPFVGLGDAPNDAPFLLQCAVVALVPSPSGVSAPLRNLFPRAYVARHPGSAGWADVIRHMGLSSGS